MCRSWCFSILGLLRHHLSKHPSPFPTNPAIQLRHTGVLEMAGGTRLSSPIPPVKQGDEGKTVGFEGAWVLSVMWERWGVLRREVWRAGALQQGRIWLGGSEGSPIAHKRRRKEKLGFPSSGASRIRGGEGPSWHPQSLAESHSSARASAEAVLSTPSHPFPAPCAGPSGEGPPPIERPGEAGPLMPKQFSQRCGFWQSCELHTHSGGAAPSPYPTSPDTFQLPAGTVARPALNSRTAGGTAPALCPKSLSSLLRETQGASWWLQVAARVRGQRGVRNTGLARAEHRFGADVPSTSPSTPGSFWGAEKPWASEAKLQRRCWNSVKTLKILFTG